jgi:hypothetical protein
MDNYLITYIQHLEMLAFFSGYPLIYYLIKFASQKLSSQFIKTDAVLILPWAYALVGTLHLTLQLTNVYPDFSIANFERRIQLPFLFIWAILSLLFWIPPFSRKPLWSIVHSLVFFFLIMKDLFLYATAVIRDGNIIKNDMRVYTVSILLNLAAFILLFLFCRLFGFRKR